MSVVTDIFSAMIRASILGPHREFLSSKQNTFSPQAGNASHPHAWVPSFIDVCTPWLGGRRYCGRPEREGVVEIEFLVALFGLGVSVESSPSPCLAFFGLCRGRVFRGENCFPCSHITTECHERCNTCSLALASAYA